MFIEFILLFYLVLAFLGGAVEGVFGGEGNKSDIGSNYADTTTDLRGR